jgi:hypothetical protein
MEKENGTAREGEWSVNAIGTAAGEVWHLLKEKGRMSLRALERGVPEPRPRVLMAIGWLAREGKLALEHRGHELELWLTEA